MGELSLDGTLRHTDGVLPMVSIAKNHGIETVYVPYEEAPEAGLVASSLCAHWPTWSRISASQARLVGGSKIRPGKITRAHRGVLFLDKLPKFDQQSLEVLRQRLADPDQLYPDHRDKSVSLRSQ